MNICPGSEIRRNKQREVAKEKGGEVGVIYVKQNGGEAR